MSNADVLVELDDDVLRVIINRPEKRNPLSRPVLAAIAEAFRAHRDRDDIRLALVTAAGTKSFAAGGDLREVEAIRGVEASGQFSDESYAALDEIRRFPLPVIAALNGDALGGGAELAVACDIRLMAAHARIGFIQGRINISTSWGGGVDLMRLVGHARALSLLSRSDVIDGAEAVAIGLADAVAGAEQDFAAFVDAFIAPMRRQAPRVLRGFKAVALAQRLGLPHAQCRAVEREHFVTSWVHDDHWTAAAKVLAPAREGTTA
ncbi:MAG: enoyl-CoA hydratase/isomerase family protein [Pseudomonadota bacterium]